VGNLKPGRRRLRFGEMVSSAGATRKARGWSAQEAGVDRYVALEHLDSYSPKILRWRNPEDVGANSDLRPFEPSDVILARRGIELRKLGVAEFRGVASGHALVFRAKPGVVLPEFLPFFMLSDVFMERADGLSVGSLSRTVNLSSLLKEEFVLPPLDEQRKSARVARAATRVQELAQEANGAHRRLMQRFLLDVYTRLLRDGKPTRIDMLGEVKMGRQKAPKYMYGDNLLPYLRVANVGDLELNLSSTEMMDFSPREQVVYSLRPGDLLVTEGDLVSAFNVGRPALFAGATQATCFQNHLIRLRPAPGLEPMFLLALLEGARLNGVFARVAKTTTVSHLGARRFAETLLPIPGRRSQADIANQLHVFLTARAEIGKRVAVAKNAFRSVLKMSVPQ
jgi:type I restriction enzyme, S subunit